MITSQISNDPKYNIVEISIKTQTLIRAELMKQHPNLQVCLASIVEHVEAKPTIDHKEYYSHLHLDTPAAPSVSYLSAESHFPTQSMHMSTLSFPFPPIPSQPFHILPTKTPRSVPKIEPLQAYSRKHPCICHSHDTHAINTSIDTNIAITKQATERYLNIPNHQNRTTNHHTTDKNSPSSSLSHSQLASSNTQALTPLALPSPTPPHSWNYKPWPHNPHSQ